MHACFGVIIVTFIRDHWIIGKLLFSTLLMLVARRYSDRNKCINNHWPSRHRRGRNTVSNRFVTVWLISLWHSRVKINLRPIDCSQIAFPFRTITWHRVAFIAAVMTSFDFAFKSFFFICDAWNFYLLLFNIITNENFVI